MISNYLYTIGKYLPPYEKIEVLKDIEVNLYDYLEDNFGKKEYTDEEIETAIRIMGHPRKVAEAYMHEPRVLIGAAYIDTYWLVLKIALIGTAIGITITNMMHLTNAKEGIQLYLKIISQIWQSSLSSIGLITLIFAAIQYYSPKEKIPKDNGWSLSILEKAIQPHQRVKKFDLVVETFFLCLSVVAINQVIQGLESTQIIIPIFNMVIFKHYLIWINIVLIGSLLLNIYLLIIRKWQSVTRFISIVLDVLGVAIFTQLVYNPDLWRLNLIAEKLGARASKIETVWTKSMYITLVVVVIIVSFDVFGHLKVLLRKNK
ncbi:hypothetical protein [Clostridium sp.]|uniref:hypothetical protein n=1 Tax=Clostridium sp. TaxID=1506 RepID=UPI003D6C83EE